MPEFGCGVAGPTTPKYTPRLYLVDPDEFGRVNAPEFHHQSEMQKAGELVASLIQHHAAYVIKAMRDAGEITVRELAGRAGGEEGYLSGQLNGRYPADLDTICAWALAVRDVTVLPALDTLEGLYPRPD